MLTTLSQWLISFQIESNAKIRHHQRKKISFFHLYKQGRITWSEGGEIKGQSWKKKNQPSPSVLLLFCHYYFFLLHRNDFDFFSHHYLTNNVIIGGPTPLLSHFLASNKSSHHRPFSLSYARFFSSFQTSNDPCTFDLQSPTTVAVTLVD